MKTKSEKEEIADNVRWFRKFPLEKRFEIAFKQISAINVLKKLKPQRMRSSVKDIQDIKYLEEIKGG